MNHYKINKRSRQAGFTLLELMVVLGIILLLTTITLISLGGSGTQARINATQVTIRKITAMLKDRKEEFSRLDFNGATRKIGVANVSQGDIILVKKILAKEHFPQRYEDTLGNNVDRTTICPDPNDSSNCEDDDKSLKAESSEFLYEMLVTGKAFGLTNVSTANFEQQELGDTDEDGRLEFVDAWGQPLQFYRWPTRLIRPNGGSNQINPNNILAGLFASKFNTYTYNQDPDDPIGEVEAAYKRRKNSNNNNSFEDDFHTYNTWHTFLIMSSGDDQELGIHYASNSANYGYLAQPKSLTDFEALFDNVTNLQKDQ